MATGSDRHLVGTGEIEEQVMDRDNTELAQQAAVAAHRPL